MPGPVVETAEHSVLQHSEDHYGLQCHGKGGEVEEAVGMLVGDASVADDSRWQVHLNGRRLLNGPRVGTGSGIHEVRLVVEWVDALTVLAIDYFILLPRDRERESKRQEKRATRLR